MSTRVLVVDDAAFMRQIIRGILSEMGCEVVAEANDGNEACTKYQQTRPDLVTMDLIMPNKGGLEAMREIRESDPDARIVVISAIDQRQTLLEALRHGAVDYVVKPFETDRVREAISRAIADSYAAK